MDNALEFAGVRKAYKGFALEGVSFALPCGCIMGLIGPNGAGKTTLIKLVMNLVRRDGGTIRVFGQDNLAHEAAVKGRIGFVPDEPKFHNDVALKDIEAATAPFYPAWDEARFQALASEFQLPLRKKFKTLSHGMKTKFALALALSHGADLVLLDEPTSGLDPVFRRELLGTLSGLIEGGRTSVLFSTHITTDLERNADYVTFLKDGGVVFSEPKDDLLERWGMVKGGRELLDDDSRAFFEGLSVREHGFEGLTSRVHEARRRFGDRALVDRASLEDILCLMGKGAGHAA